MTSEIAKKTNYLSSLMQIFSCIWLSVMLTACGYHLRGESDVPEIMRHIHLQKASPPLYAMFKETLRLSGAKLSETPDPHGVVVRVTNERFDRRMLSLSSTGKTNEFQLFYELDFDVLTYDNKVVLANQRVQENRNYFNNQQDIIGKNNEEALIQEEMYRQAVRSVLDRGRALVKQSEKK